MKTTLTFLTVLCLLPVCVPATGQSDILSAIPADAYGFVATNDLQASYDNIMLFAKAIGAPVPEDNKLLPIQDNVGEVDLNGPAAVVLLDPQKFSEPPVALLLSAADAKAVFQAHQANAEETDEELPPGVVKGADGYIAVKNGFVVYAPKADHVVAVLAGQDPHQIMPAAKQAFDKGQIVLAGDLRGAAPFMIQTLNKVQAQMNAQMAAVATQIPQMATAMEMVSVYMDLAQSLVGQSDKLTVALDINAERAVLTKRVLFKADSAAATLMNAQMGLPAPTYNALPGGPFFVAGGANMVPEQLSNLAEVILTKLFELPTFKDKLSAEHTAQMIADSKASNAMSSGMAFTVNLGSPMTGMINMVGRSDVSNSAELREHTAKVYQAEYMSAYTKAFGGPPMDFVYTSAAESYSGVDIDTIKMQITPPEPAAEDDPMAQQMQMMMAQQMQMMAMMYGPDMTFRLAAPNEKQVLFVMGGAGRMERAINVAQGNGSVLADDPRIIQAAAKLPAKRFAEAHLDLTQVVPMLGMFASMAGVGDIPAAPPGQAPNAPLISFSASAEDNAVRVDLVVPAETVRNLISSFSAMQSGPAGPAPEVPSEDFEEDLE
ncbi:MAG: hypothetical protein KAT11_02245 [Phycisphaerae bacterium]|nr:hypothetical protein [Phycisphaerae bacterium]